MAILKIRTNPDPILRRKAKKIAVIDASIRKLIDDMVETMQESYGVGLAANQVGVPLRVVVIQVPEQEVLVLVNPVIVETKGERMVIEGCLSVPGYQAEVPRAESVRVQARDRNGKIFRKRGTELLAQALQHEIDHLNGMLYIDYLKDKSQLRKTDSFKE
jgi:peptide deformylase